MAKPLTFAMAVYKYACHQYDNYGQTLNGYYPMEEHSVLLDSGAWILKDNRITYCKVCASGKVIT